MAKKPLPEFVPPMTANSVKEPFDSPDWIFEVKLDGYRVMAFFATSVSLTLGRVICPVTK
jgi:bifunctional non-homologous end joining protein LigD